MKLIKEASQDSKRIEIIVFSIVWLTIYTIPYFVQQTDSVINWDKLLYEWLRISTFLAIFILNITILVPRLLFPKKYFQYVSAALIITIFLSTLSVKLQYDLVDTKPTEMPRMEIGPGMPPMELSQQMPLPMGYRAPEQSIKPSMTMMQVNSLIISLLVIGASMAFKMVSKWLTEESLRKDVEKVQLKTELALLRHQVSPHFLMNTLNNIHALIDIDTDKAKNAVLRLSTLMRYLLYETSQGTTKLKKEVEFIESYFSLMRIRFSDKVIVNCELPSYIPDIQIPAMLFISFVENAFKHGVSYQAESFVNFSIQIMTNSIVCKISNSKHDDQQFVNKKYSGIGLQNVRKNLDLLFPGTYSLEIIETDKEFEVKLIIPYDNNKVLSN